MSLQKSIESIVFNTVSIPTSKDKSVKKLVELVSKEILLAYATGLVDGGDYIQNDSPTTETPLPEDYLVTRI